MNSTIRNSKLLASALCGLLLVGCDSIKSVPEEPSAILPPATAILGGTITGLSSLRSVTLLNNLVDATSKSFLAPAPNTANVNPEIPFSLGSFPVGSNYSVTVKDQPFGKTCTVTSGGTGVISTTVLPDVRVNCVNTGVRYDLTVNLPTNPAFFTGLSSPKVRLITEDRIYEVGVTSGQTTVFFDDVLLNAAATTGELNRFTWTVTASTEESGRLNKCFVTNATNVDPTANVIAPLIGNGSVNLTTGVVTQPTSSACSFTIGGRVAYSMPAGVATAPAMPTAGVTLALRDVNNLPVSIAGTPVAPVTVTSFASPGNAFVLTTAARSNSSAVYEVVVTSHPPGMRCIVAQTTDGTANLFRQGLVNPNSLSDVQVFCRNSPTGANILSGTYRFTNRVLYLQSLLAGSVAPNYTYTNTVSTWDAFNLTVQNTASNNLLTFFNDGTFLYGTHAGSNQVEHGFYEYLTAPGRLRFTIVSDTNNATTAETNGLSFLPGRLNTATTISTIVTPPAVPVAITLPTRNLGSVAIGTTTETTDAGVSTLRRITGVFGSQTVPLTGAAAPSPAEGSGPTLINWANPTPPVAPVPPAAAATVPVRYDWELTEPVSLNGEMTGTFISQDHLRFWVWDYRTYYGTHVSAVGGTLSMNDACFTMEDLRVASGIYTRRGSATGCYPWNRPFTNQVYTFTGAEAIDFVPTHSTLGNAANRTAGLTALSQIPGFIGRVPGGQTAFDGRSPSPIYFKAAPAASFFSGADLAVYPDPVATPAQTPYNTGALTTWCPGAEILGIRATLHGTPIENPVYLCRIRAN